MQGEIQTENNILKYYWLCWRMQVRSQDFSWGGGGGGGRGYVWEVKIQTCRGVRGHVPPGKF